MRCELYIYDIEIVNMNMFINDVDYTSSVSELLNQTEVIRLK